MRNLIALFFSVLLATGLVGGAYSLYEGTTTRVSTSLTIEQVQELAAKMQARYQLRANGYGTAAIADKTVIGFNMHPSSMAIDNSGDDPELVHEWKGDVAVTGSDDGNYLIITLSGIPEDACQDILSNITPRTGILKYSVADETPEDDDSAVEHDSDTGGFPEAGILTNCASSNDNNMHFFAGYLDQ